MRIAGYIPSSWRLILRNRLRSFLSMLGIVIGILSIMIIMSVGAGAQSLILNQVKSLGSNLIGIIPGKSDDQGPPAAVFGIVITTLTADDVRAIIGGGNSHIVSGTGYVRGADTITSGESKTDGSFVGVNANYPYVEDITLEAGRFFEEEDDMGLSRVAVLGSEIAQELFNDSDPIGRFVKIKRTNFQVIGVLKERGVAGFQNQDNQIFVPLLTAQKLLLGIDYISFMRIKIDEAENVESSMETIKEILRDRHTITNPDNDDFSVRSANQGLDAVAGITNAIRFFLAAIAAISLIVGGIGIMNIMLAAVEERTREIGLRKALGAARQDIINQFLVESVMITFIGGIIGVVFGIAVSTAVAQIARAQGYEWDLIISPWSVGIGCGVAAIIGLIFGINPARKAARLNPIDALRYE